jgi:hypothetical protein
VTIEQIARQAANHAVAMNQHLQSAACVDDRNEKRRLLVRAFTAYGAAVRNMSLLEQAAPNCAREGLEEAARIGDFVQGRGD